MASFVVMLNATNYALTLINKRWQCWYTHILGIHPKHFNYFLMMHFKYLILYAPAYYCSKYINDMKSFSFHKHLSCLSPQFVTKFQNFLSTLIFIISYLGTLWCCNLQDSTKFLERIYKCCSEGNPTAAV